MRAHTSKFDYPQIAAMPYLLQNSSKLAEKAQAQKTKYREFDREQRGIERMRVQNEKEKKMEGERKRNRKKLEEELERKKVELIELQKIKNLIIDEEKLSHERALLRRQQQKYDKIEKQKRIVQNDQNAKNRFLQALKRLEKQRQLNNEKEKEALQRRKAAQQTQKKQRNKAVKYRQNQQEKQRQMELEKQKSMKHSLGRSTTNRTIDYSKTFLHHPRIVMDIDNEENAMERAYVQNSKEKEKSVERQTRNQENRKISEERGRIALEKLALEREYREYLAEQQQKAKLYNLQRIEAGKKNQYMQLLAYLRGLKPSTLLQMQTNKKLRVQQQFEKMFFEGDNPEWFDLPASRYSIQQSKFMQEVKNGNELTLKGLENNGNMGGVVSESYCSFKSLQVDEVPYKEYGQRQDKICEKEQSTPLPQQSKILNEYNEAQEQKRQQLSYSYSQDEQC